MSVPEVLNAAPRDASWYSSPDVRTAKAMHVDRGNWLAACNGMPLDGTLARPAAEVARVARCGRPGCRERWPAWRWSG